jgi:hypothetical protein
VSGLLLAFLATLALDWPRLPFNARLTDLIFPLLAVGVLTAVRPWPRLHHLDAAVACYLLGGLPSLAVTTDLGASLVELVRQSYLVAVYLVVALAVSGGYARLVMAGLATGGGALATAGLAAVLLVLVAGVSAPGAGQVMALPYVGEVMRLRAFTASEAMLACLLAMAVPCALWLRTNAAGPAGRIAWTGALVAGLAATVLTFAAAASGVVVACLVALWPHLRSHRVLRASAVAATLVIVAALNLGVVASVRTVRVGDTVVTDRTAYHHGVDEGRLAAGPLTVDYAVMSYARLKTLAWEAFRERPWTGVGLDRFHDVSARAHAGGRLPDGYRAIDPHSTLLGRLAETGIAGGITLLALWWAFGAAAWRLTHGTGQTAAMTAAVAAGLAGLLVASANVDVMNLRFVWVGLGVVRGITSPLESRVPEA